MAPQINNFIIIEMMSGNIQTKPIHVSSKMMNFISDCTDIMEMLTSTENQEEINSVYFVNIKENLIISFDSSDEFDNYVTNELNSFIESQEGEWDMIKSELENFDVIVPENTLLNKIDEDLEKPDIYATKESLIEAMVNSFGDDLLANIETVKTIVLANAETSKDKNYFEDVMSAIDNRAKLYITKEVNITEVIDDIVNDAKLYYKDTKTVKGEYDIMSDFENRIKTEMFKYVDATDAKKIKNKVLDKLHKSLKQNSILVHSVLTMFNKAEDLSYLVYDYHSDNSTYATNFAKQNKIDIDSFVNEWVSLTDFIFQDLTILRPLVLNGEDDLIRDYVNKKFTTYLDSNGDISPVFKPILARYIKELISQQLTFENTL